MKLALVLAFFLVVACAAPSADTPTALGDEYIGTDIDPGEWGPFAASDNSTHCFFQPGP